MKIILDDALDSSLGDELKIYLLEQVGINNVNYTRWALEAIPVEILYEYELSELSVVFEKECSYGEEIKSICEIKETEEGYFILHKIENIEGKELATLISKWKK